MLSHLKVQAPEEVLPGRTEGVSPKMLVALRGEDLVTSACSPGHDATDQTHHMTAERGKKAASTYQQSETI